MEFKDSLISLRCLKLDLIESDFFVITYCYIHGARDKKGSLIINLRSAFKTSRTRKVFKKKTYLRFTWLYILIIIINTKLTSYASH